MRRTVRDKDVLDRIGCQGAYQYACVDDDGAQDDMDAPTQALAECWDEEDEFDNSNCDADFEKVGDGYSGNEGYMRGMLLKMEKKPSDRYSRCIGVYSRDGMYKMESRRGVTAYLGKDGRAQCIALPQCKMMNSTVLDDVAKHKVYVGEADPTVKTYCGTYGKSGLYGRNAEKWLAGKGFDPKGTHIPFDLWCVLGVVFGKALKVWRGVAKLDMRKMPSWMYVELDEVFEGLNPGCKWSDLSGVSRKEWVRLIHRSFDRMRGTGMAWDMPNKGDGSRTAFWSVGMLESTFVYRRVSKSEEQACVSEWGDAYEPCGFKVHLKGNPIFDFCWRMGVNSPSVVQIRRYEHDVRKVLGTKGWTRCFHMIWASWLVQYRNYWTRRNMKYETCVLEWSQREMLKGFKDSVFEIRHLDTDEMVRILSYHTQRSVFASGDRRPAHIADVSVVRRCVVAWTLPRTLAGESVLVKNESGMNISLDEAGLAAIPKEVEIARQRMEEINQENARHVVTVGGRRIDTSESVIYTGEVVDGQMRIIPDMNGRCYSMKNGIQALKREERRSAKIDGGKVAEVDFHSLHPNILYSLNGIQTSGDMYDVGRWYCGSGLTKEKAREACKMMMLRIINAKSTIVALYSFKKEWNIENGHPPKSYIPWMFDLFNAIKRKHKAIAHEFCTGKGVRLMNLDGKLIREVCHRLARERICCLAVHDSVLVDCRFAEKAAGIMREEYSKMFNGHTIEVKY